MKIVMTLLVRDEEDILEANLRHHLAAGIDEIIVTDNRSTDATPQILADAAALGRVRVLREPGEDYAQSRWVTRMARLAAEEHGADWVLHADADEFIAAKFGSIRDALGLVPAGFGVIAAPRLDFRPVSPSPLPFYERMTVRDVRAVNPRGQPLRPKASHRGHPGATLGQGNHAVAGVPGPIWGDCPLVMFHYALRSYGQFERKVRLGGAAYERNTELSAAAREPWRTLYELYQRGGLRDWYDARELPADELGLRVRAGKAVVDRRMAARLRAVMAPTR